MGLVRTSRRSLAQIHLRGLFPVTTASSTHSSFVRTVPRLPCADVAFRPCCRRPSSASRMLPSCKGCPVTVLRRYRHYELSAVLSDYSSRRLGFNRQLPVRDVGLLARADSIAFIYDWAIVSNSRFCKESCLLLWRRCRLFLSSASEPYSVIIKCKVASHYLAQACLFVVAASFVTTAL